MKIQSLRHISSRAIMLGALGIVSQVATAADHIDMPQSASAEVITRPDASITDFYAFVSGSKFVMILNLHPFMAPDGSNTYPFPTDVQYKFNLDLDAEVSIGDDVVSKEFGGVVMAPDQIKEDLVFQITFDEKRKPTLDLTCHGPFNCSALHKARLFTGLRAESFIFAPVVRNNVGSIVLEFPVSLLVSDATQTTFLLWATTSVETPSGVYTELAGRADRSQFNQDKSVLGNINALHPSKHVANGFLRPDVMIIDVSKTTAFPNGRALTENVNKIVDGFTLLATDHIAAATEINGCKPGGFFFPCPIEPPASVANVRLLEHFPYVGRPYKANEKGLENCDLR